MIEILRCLDNSQGKESWETITRTINPISLDFARGCRGIRMQMAEIEDSGREKERKNGNEERERSSFFI